MDPLESATSESKGAPSLIPVISRTTSESPFPAQSGVQPTAVRAPSATTAQTFPAFMTILQTVTPSRPYPCLRSSLDDAWGDEQQQLVVFAEHRAVPEEVTQDGQLA